MRRSELADPTVFIAVADNLSFRTAATRLGVTPLRPQPHGPDDGADLREAPPAPARRSSCSDFRRGAGGDTALGSVQCKESHTLRPGAIDGFGGAIPLHAHISDEDVAHAVAFGVGEPTVQREAMVEIEGRGDTCHLDVIDRHGNMIAVTPSGGWLQNSPVIPELGFCLSTRGQMFWLEEGLPASLAPGKRPRTKLSPSFTLRDGKPYMAFGTPGDDQQDQWSLHVFLRHVHFGMNLQEAMMRRRSTPSTRRARSSHASPGLAIWPSKGASQRPPSTSFAAGGTTSSFATAGASAG